MDEMNNLRFFVATDFHKLMYSYVVHQQYMPLAVDKSLFPYSNSREGWLFPYLDKGWEVRLGFAYFDPAYLLILYILSTKLFFNKV